MLWRKYDWTAATAIPAVVFLLGLCISATAGWWVKRDIDTKSEATFQHSVDRVSAEISRRFRQPLYGLQGAKGMYAANSQITRAQFRAYVDSRDLAREFPGVNGFGFIKRVPRTDLDAFLAAERADDAPQFAIRRLGNENMLVPKDLYIIKFIEPLGHNFAAFGLDLGSERLRRAGIEQAIETGDPTLSAPITLVQDERRGAGFLLFVPVFRHGTDPTTASQRRSALIGLLYAPMFAADLLRGIADVDAELADFELYDVTGTAGSVPASQRVFDSFNSASHPGHIIATPLHSRFQAMRNVELPGRDLKLRVRSTPQFDATISGSPPWLLFAGGALISAMLAMLLRKQASGRHRAEVFAQHMTTDLERLAQVAKHTSNAVLITDRELRITWVNEGFNRIYTQFNGRAPGDMSGKTLNELLKLTSGKIEPAMLKTLANAIASGACCRIEISHRAEGGCEHWLDVELQPLHDSRGELTGYMEIGSDITERKRADIELRKLSRAIEQSPASIVITDRAGLIDYVNPRFEQVSGYPKAEVIGRNPRILQSGRTAPAVYKELWAAISAGEEWRGELCNRRRNGEPYWEIAAISGVRGENGEIEHYIAVKEDITDRRQAEMESRHQSEVMSSVLENLPCGLSVFNADLRLVAENAKFRHILDLPDTLFDVALPDFEDIIRFSAARGEYGTDDIEATVKAIVDRARLPSVPYQFERIGPTGTPLEIRGSPMPGGGFVTTYTDISARRQAETEVKRSTELLRGAIDAIDEAFVLFDPDDRLVFCNDKYRHIFGSMAEPIVPGMSFEDVLRRYAEHYECPAHSTSVDEWVAERKAAHNTGDTTVVQRLNDGRSLRIVERRMPDGHIVGFRIDITELVRATEAAQEAKAIAEAATIAKSQFLANMSHEIRTPMNAILGMLALLRKTELTNRQADYAAKTEGAARALLGLLNDILDFSKVEAGKMTLDPHPFRIDQLLRDLSVILSANIGPKNVEVLFDIDPALPRHLVGDAMRLQQVLINLSGNAIKFTAEGEVVVSLKVANLEANAVTLEISVRDTGIGIARKTRHAFSAASRRRRPQPPAVLAEAAWGWPSVNAWWR
ncbi:MAG: PAS-domain containing protein [Betaproteobacteria bacterium]|nr:PAS-domain containing protein [Betaproteobacteria bacterium]